MDIKQLKYFLAIANEMNITKAAQKLHMSQPPLSAQLKMLEEEIGRELFKRTTRNLEITEAGEFLRNRAVQIIDLMENTIHELKNIEDLHGILKIGYVASSVPYVLNKIIPEFFKNNPEVKFELKEGNTYKVLDLLTNGIIDVGFIRTPFDSKDFNCIFLEKEPMAVVFNKNLYFENKKEIKVGDLENVPLIIDKRFKKLITDACHHRGFMPKFILEGEDSRSLSILAENGVGIAVVPRNIKEIKLQENLKILKIKSKSLETQMVMVTMKNKKLPQVAKHLFNYISRKEN